MRTRNLRDHRQGAARHSEQGVSGARRRRPAGHGRHAGCAGAARPGRRSPEARRGGSVARGRHRSLGAHRRRRPGRLRASGQRGSARRALAEDHRTAPVKRLPFLPSARMLLAAVVAAYAAGFAALSALRHDAFVTGRFDLGNMVQAVWSTAHGHPLRMTDLHGDQISRLAAHVDPILVLFAPLWWIWPSPHLLLVTQALVVAVGAVPVFLLARKHLGSGRAGLGFAIAYLLY